MHLRHDRHRNCFRTLYRLSWLLHRLNERIPWCIDTNRHISPEAQTRLPHIRIPVEELRQGEIAVVFSDRAAGVARLDEVCGAAVGGSVIADCSSCYGGVDGAIVSSLNNGGGGYFGGKNCEGEESTAFCVQ
jgi:hypothetical protein